ncbi:sterol carrier family protein [Frankia sp. Cpl3]|uniref:sterol carrier family protein n=1 Tax=Parafrankia colletiae TaxID=573497 RepID=UPI001F51FC97|nr:sterol carrier family protein [Parafrankia colletiae]MCK9903375.1 sterol carrier family protein [Frankia sp. Cpl3]
MGADPDLARTLAEQWTAVADHVDLLSDDQVAGPAATPGLTMTDLIIQATSRVLALDRAVRGLPAAPPQDGDPEAGRQPADPAGGRPAGIRAEFRNAVAAATAGLTGTAGPASSAGPTDSDPGPEPEPGSGSGDVRAGAVAEAVVLGLGLGATPVRAALRTTVRLITALLAQRAPGRAVELRVPPFAAVQIVEGPRHTRGTPPNVVEVEPSAFVLVATGRLGWEEAVADGRIRASGERADLRSLLPLSPPLPQLPE